MPDSSTAFAVDRPPRRTGVRRMIVSLRSLFVGLGVTLPRIFGKKVTQQYPHELPEMSGAYRSAIELVRFEELGTHECIACSLCVEICPSRCIHIEGDRLPGMKKKRAELFTMDFSLCSLCGLCLAVCPTETLKYSRGYDAAGYRQDAWVHDLLAPFAGEHTPEEVAALLTARDEAKREETMRKVAGEKAEKAAEEGDAEADGAAPARARETGAGDG